MEAMNRVPAALLEEWAKKIRELPEDDGKALLALIQGSGGGALLLGRENGAAKEEAPVERPKPQPAVQAQPQAQAVPPEVLRPHLIEVLAQVTQISMRLSQVRDVRFTKNEVAVRSALETVEAATEELLSNLTLALTEVMP